MARIATFIALALQLVGCAAPASAFVICISNDGCAEIEPSVPGASRCPEDRCDAPHAGDSSHACRDIPVLADAAGPARIGGVGDPAAPALIALTPAPRLAAPAITWAPRIPPAAARGSAAPRTVVLQL